VTAPVSAGPLIELESVEVRFGRAVALADLSFTMCPGESLALWGENGAGKTTALRALMGLVPYAGSIRVGGREVRSSGPATRASVGYVPQQLTFYGDMRAADLLTFVARLRAVEPATAGGLLERVGLAEHAAKPTAALSGGMRQRLALAMALLGDPRVLLLDEPTANLDAEARADFIELLAGLNADGKTLLFTSHRLDEVKALAGQAVVLERGRVRAACAADRLERTLYARSSVDLFPEPAGEDDLGRALAVLRSAGFEAVRNGTAVRVLVETERRARPIAALIGAGMELRDVSIESVQDRRAPGDPRAMEVVGMSGDGGPSARGAPRPTGIGSKALGRVSEGHAVADVANPPRAGAAVPIIARKEIRDALRNRWFLLYSAAFAGLALALSRFAVGGGATAGFAGYGRTAASLVNLVLLIVPLMGLTLGSAALASERENGTLALLLAQPIRRLDILLGKYLGLALALASSLALGFGLAAAILAAEGGGGGAGPYLSIVGFAMLLAWASLSIGCLISVLSGRVGTATGVALVAWLILVFAGDLGLMGTAVTLRLDARTLLALALVNPLDVFKVAAVSAITGTLDTLGPAGVYAGRTLGAWLHPALTGLLTAWILVPLALGSVLFARRSQF